MPRGEPTAVDAKPTLEWLSLVEVFESAEHVRALSHASPGAVVALHELLLGLCYQAGFAPERVGEWNDWVDERESLAQVAEFLRSPALDGRMDLFHPTQPFGQNSLLAPHLDSIGYGTAQLVLEQTGDYNQLFDHVHLYDQEGLSPQEAFVAMLVQHCYGTGGRMMGSLSRHFGKAMTYGAVARLGARVRVLALGDSLADTLRLNLAPQPEAIGPHFNFTWTDLPDRRDFRAPKARTTRKPKGPADLHSSLGRSVLLRPRGEGDALKVDRVLVAAGELLGEPSLKLDQDLVFKGDYPLRAAKDRALWRDAHAIYAAFDPHSRARGGLYERLAGLSRQVELLAVGLVAKQMDISGWVRDVFPYAPGRGDALRAVAKAGATMAEQVVDAVKEAAKEAERAVYPKPNPEQKRQLRGRFDPGTELWGRFDEPFHRLLTTVAAGANPHEAERTYAEALVALARGALDERLRPVPLAKQRAVARAHARMERQLQRPQLHATLRETARMTTASVSDTTPARDDPESQLVRLLAGFVLAQDRSSLAALRRPRGREVARLRAENRAPTEEARERYGYVAFLFARFHLDTVKPRYGYGDLGHALRRLGHGAERGPRNESCDRMFQRLINASDVPESELQHAIERLRHQDRHPPNWALLARDLCAWHDKGEPVQRRWARSFYTPDSSRTSDSSRTERSA
ncbi:type I-E CRISPR-associated protein Cse2/CasB [Streptomyces triticirhizae]|nr:type I-E CRISPR-associated protein Cse2/CasB [Streptomyces triticirhizae]